MESEHFKLNSLYEVKLFCEKLDDYQKSKLDYALPYIDLITAFEKLQEFSQGGRLFAALLDLKLSFVMLSIDFSYASITWNKYFSIGKFQGGSVLDNQQKFNGKVEMQYYYGNFIPKYRAIWDKIMGILILVFKPESYDEYKGAKSRKKNLKNCVTTSHRFLLNLPKTF